MPRLLSILFFAAALFGQEGAWKEIFPDSRFTGWHRVSVPPGKPVGEPSQWKVDAAARTILCEGNGGHEMILFDTEYSDFDLHVEWKYAKLPDENARYNSGIYVRNNQDGSIWHQAQAGATAFLFGKTVFNGEPKSFNLRQQAKENPVKPAGEWNTYDIRSQGQTIALSVNGKPLNEFTECGVPKGYFGLEAEGFRIEFRNIRVRTVGR